MNVDRVLGFSGNMLVDLVKEHPWAALAAAYAVARMFGTVVETGWCGVLFSFGRVKSELQPGFHWLLPVVHHVRKVRVRSVSLDLPPQRIVTRDGLVYNVDANVVYHVADAQAAAVQIDDVHQGCSRVIPMEICSLLREQDSKQLADRSRLDEELAARLQLRLTRWGIQVEHAGLKSTGADTRDVACDSAAAALWGANRECMRWSANEDCRRGKRWHCWGHRPG